MTKPRHTRTPQQRAQEALDVAERNVKRLQAAVEKHAAALAAAQAEHDTAIVRRDYLAQSPDLAGKPEL